MNIDTIQSVEKIVITRCSDCGRVTPTMYRLRTGFSVTATVCQYCYDKYSYSVGRSEYQNFAKQDKANNKGLKSVKQSSSFMREHLDTNFLTEENKKAKRQKNRISKLKKSVNSTLGNAMKSLYYMASKESISISGQYKILEYTNNNNETVRCYYTLDLVGEVVPRFLMNSKGKIIQYF